MDIPSAIQSLLSEEDVDLLRQHGDLLHDLASGRIQPETERQKEFVSSLQVPGNTRRGGRSELAWKRYVALATALIERPKLELQIRSSREQVSALESTIALLSKEIELLRSAPALQQPARSPQVSEKLSGENLECLKRYSYLATLCKLGLVDSSHYSTFVASNSDLRIALYNEEKIAKFESDKHPPSGATPSSSRGTTAESPQSSAFQEAPEDSSPGLPNAGKDAVSSLARRSYEFCHQCGGDGGAGGRCPRCGGNGFEPTR